MKNIAAKILSLTVAFATLAAVAASAAERPARAAVEHAIAVKEVVGAAEYAYDSTGWRPLLPGKILHPGAYLRTGTDAKVLLAMEEEGSFVRMGPLARLEIAKAAPVTEQNVPSTVQAQAARATLQIVYTFLDSPRALAALH